MRAIDTNVLVLCKGRRLGLASRPGRNAVGFGRAIRTSNAQIAEAVEKLMIHDDLVMQDEDVVAASLRHFKGNARVSFSDCLIVKNLAKVPDAQAL